MFYNTCPHCGANLDPGEQCDCQKTKKGEPTDANQTDSPKEDEKDQQNPTSAHSISLTSGNVNPLRFLRLSKELPVADLVATVKELYPKYDRQLQSKCEHGEVYGIQLRTNAWDKLLAKYAPDILEREKHRRDGCHRLKCKVSCRLETNEYADLMKRIREDGFDTTQAWLTFMIRKYLKNNHKSKGAYSEKNS